MICRMGVPLKVMSLVKVPVDRSKEPPIIRIMSGLQATGRESSGTRAGGMMFGRAEYVSSWMESCRVEGRRAAV